MNPMNDPQDMQSGAPLNQESDYCCTACGEQIVVPLDISAGNPQEYVEDCPVCCRPHLLRIAWTEGVAQIIAVAES